MIKNVSKFKLQHVYDPNKLIIDPDIVKDELNGLRSIKEKSWLTLIQNLQGIFPVKKYQKLYEIYDVLMNPFTAPDIWQQSVEQLFVLTNNK